MEHPYPLVTFWVIAFIGIVACVLIGPKSELTSKEDQETEGFSPMVASESNYDLWQITRFSNTPLQRIESDTRTRISNETK